MKQFKFGLQTVLEWRDRQAERERGILEGLHADRKRLEREGEHVSQQIATTQAACADQAPALSEDLQQLAGYVAALRTRAERLRHEVADCLHSINAQSGRLQAAKRDHELLVKMRDRRMADWRYELNRETEEGAAESWLAGYVREAGRGAPKEEF